MLRRIDTCKSEKSCFHRHAFTKMQRIRVLVDQVSGAISIVVMGKPNRPHSLFRVLLIRVLVAKGSL